MHLLILQWGVKVLSTARGQGTRPTGGILGTRGVLLCCRHGDSQSCQWFRRSGTAWCSSPSLSNLLRRHLGLHAGHVGHQIDDAVGVAPLVVIPARFLIDQFYVPPKYSKRFTKEHSRLTDSRQESANVLTLRQVPPEHRIPREWSREVCQYNSAHGRISPGYDFNEVGPQHDAGVGVKDGRVGVMLKVGRHHGVLSVAARSVTAINQKPSYT